METSVKKERTQRKGSHSSIFVTINVAKELLKPFNIKTVTQYRELSKNLQLPQGVPSKPFNSYKNRGWIDWSDYLGSEIISPQDKKFLTYEESIPVIRRFGFKSGVELRKYVQKNGLIKGIPSAPHSEYKNNGWVSMGEWLGTGTVQTQELAKQYVTYEDAEKWAQSQNIKSANSWRILSKEKKIPFNVPANPHSTYKDKGWISWGKFLGTGKIADNLKDYMSYDELEKLIQTKGFEKSEDYFMWWEKETPNNIPKTPDASLTYKNEWVSWGKFLGTGLTNMEKSKLWVSYVECKKYAEENEIKNQRDWFEHIENNRPQNIPSAPQNVYENNGWINWASFLGQIGDGKHQWKKKSLYIFISSLQTELSNLDSIELITIINSNNLAHRLDRMGRLDNLLSTRSGSQERQDVVNEILNIVNSSDDDTTIEETTETQITTVQDVLTQEQIDTIITTQEQEEELPRVNLMEEMRAYDNNMLTASLDDENVDFLLKNGLKKIWVEVLSNRFDVEVYRTEEGGENFNIIKEWFFNEYDEAMNLPLPKDYHFKDSNGNLNDPNLMQRLISLRTIRDKSYGNWSDTGTGKTLAGLLTGRIYAANGTIGDQKTGSFTTLIVCNNATVTGWEKSINEYFSNNRIFNKATMGDIDVNIVSQESLGDKVGHNYIIVNYEKFQQKDGELFAYKLVHELNIGYVILDEVHNIKQREVDNESIRRNNVVKLITALREKNPQLMLSAMSATPIINNFYEPKAIIELLTGEIHKEIETTENIQNGIELYKLLTRHGLRYKGIKFVKENTDIRRINGNHLLEDINGLTAGDLLKTEQILLKDKLDNIKNDIKKGTLIYTHYITGLKNNIGEYVKSLGFTVGYYTGGDKEGLQLFKDGKVDVLIGSTPVGTGVDGIQKVCDRMIILNLPWTNADFKQLKGRVIDRTGCIFDKVDVIIPQVFIEDGEGKVIWDWDNWRYERVKFKKTLMDLVLDGEIPEGKLPSKQKLLQDALVQLGIWKERIENGEILTTQREELKVPLNPEMVEVLKRKFGDFREMNRLWSVRNSTTNRERLLDHPEEWYQYHTLYREARQDWDEIPFEVIGEKISKRPDWIVGDFGCGENLLSKNIPNKVHAFDHISIDETVVSCDISNVPLEDNTLDVAVFSLSLMGTNYKDYLEEGYRTLRPFGMVMVCEPKGTWEENPTELLDILKGIGFAANIERVSDKFIYIVGSKL